MVVVTTYETPTVRVRRSGGTGRSLRKAIDWLTPYATRHTPWPYSQPKTPDWMTMFSVLRRAATAYGERTYEEAGCAVLREMGKSKNYNEDIMNLQLPPTFSVTC